MQIQTKLIDLYFPCVDDNVTPYFVDHQNGHHKDKVATIKVALKFDICRRRSYTFLLWYFSHKGVWADDEIHNEIQPTQQCTSIKDIAKVKTSVVDG